MVSIASHVTGTGLHVTAGGPDQAGRSTDQDGPALAVTGDRSAAMAQHRRPVRAWPLLVLAAPAAVAVWSGWVGIGISEGAPEILHAGDEVAALMPAQPRSAVTSKRTDRSFLV